MELNLDSGLGVAAGHEAGAQLTLIEIAMAEEKLVAVSDPYLAVDLVQVLPAVEEVIVPVAISVPYHEDS